VRCRLLGDEEVRGLTAAAAVDAMREAVLLADEGRLSAPPRVRTDLDDLGYVFTVGGVSAGPAGFRVYRVGESGGDQLVAVWNADGELEGLVVGDELGARRTGALGAVAADALARADAETVAVIGSGDQAWTQLWALQAVRRLTAVRIYSRNPERRDRFAHRVTAGLGLAAEAVSDPGEAVRGADLIILATRSPSPVIDADDVAAGAHVVTVGPKSRDRHETPLELVDRAQLITCDSPEQATAYGAPFFVDRDALIGLGAVLSGRHPGRRSPEEITLHCSVGLAGTEVMLAQRLLDQTGR